MTSFVAQLSFTPSYNRGVIKDLVEQIPEADFDIASDDSQGQVEIIGWFYQYYNQELKEVAIGAPNSHKFDSHEIASATQIFTPDWIVKYMVQNSVGKTWIKHLMQNDPTLQEKDLARQFKWLYYMPDADQSEKSNNKTSEIDTRLVALTPENLTMLDPAMGSGHILVYAFDLLVQIYQSEGFSTRRAASLIIQHNLFGLDIDQRAFQLAYFSVMMKFRKYDRHALDSNLVPNIMVVINSKGIGDDELALAFPNLIKSQLENVHLLHATFKNADLTGSLTDVSKVDLAQTQQTLGELQKSTALFADQFTNTFSQLLMITKILQSRYQTVVTNPPYMGSSRMSLILSSFARQYYPNAKSDLFAMFLDHFNHIAPVGGYVAMVTMQSWMFLSSFEQLRVWILDKRTISNLMHMENNVMGIAFGTAVAIIRNDQNPDFIGTYHQIKTSDVSSGSIPQVVPIPGNRFNRTNQANFEKIPGSPIAYWASINVIHAFIDGRALSSISHTIAGGKTGDNNHFTRLWHEISFDGIKLNSLDGHGATWVPYNKGGDRRLWYGNDDYVVLWKDDGEEVRSFRDAQGNTKSRMNSPYLFSEGITWSVISSGKIGVRYRPIGSIADMAAAMFLGDHQSNLRIMGLLNSVVGLYFVKLLSPTINLKASYVGLVPYLKDIDRLNVNIVEEQISLSKREWDSSEISWNFSKMPLIQNIAEHNRNWTVEAAFNQWSKEAEDRFNQLKSNEEELNRIFIDLYGLQDELTPEVADKDVSVRKADRPRDIKAFLSYFVGVVFGRYSLDVPGLAFAGGEWNASKYKTFLPNKDDIILLTDEDYFDDDRDIIHRLKEFLTVTFGAEHLDENLAYVADSLDKKGDTPEAQIRKYFMDDFYKKDHLSTYQKRPIYWQLTSGKNNGFKALMYLHRYDENTLAMIRTTYLHPLQEAYVNRRTQLAKMIEVESNTRQRNQMTKSVTRLDKQIDEIAKYDTSLQHVANMHIVLDLDDGVLVNHEKAQGGQKLLSPLK